VTKLLNIIDKTDFYEIADEQHFCCDESQFKYYCEKHLEFMGCYFCQFDYDKDCEEQH
jgi:hypothetical protein